MATDLERLLAIPNEELVKLPIEEQNLWIAAVERAKRLATPASFGEWAMPGFRQFRHVKTMADEIVKMVDDDECDILVVEVSVRHGKSWLCSVAAPAWYLSRFPERSVGLAGYESDFAANWGRRARSAMEAAGPSLGLSLDKRSSAASRWDLILPDGRTGGGMWTAGAGGPIEGKGYHLGIIDDPIKNREEADSQERRDKIWEWWESTFVPRGEPGNKIIIVMSRWHEDDLIGRLKADSGGKRLRTVRLPALAEENDILGRDPGEALCPERYDAEDLESLRESVGTWTWAARYQQRPQPAGGGTFHERDFRYWRKDDRGLLLDHGDRIELVDLDECYRFATADVAFTKNKRSDWTVCAHWAVTPGGDLVLRDLDRVQIEGPDHLPLLERAWNHRPRPAWVGVERTTSSLTLIAMAQRAGILTRELRPDRNKQSRAEAAATMCAQGRVFFPKGAPWLDVFEAELLGFPTAAHDDCVDVLAYAANEVARGTVRGRKTPNHEPRSLEQQVRDRLSKMRDRRKTHPVLGSF